MLCASNKISIVLEYQPRAELIGKHLVHIAIEFNKLFRRPFWETLCDYTGRGDSVNDLPACVHDRRRVYPLNLTALAKTLTLDHAHELDAGRNPEFLPLSPRLGLGPGTVLILRMIKT